MSNRPTSHSSCWTLRRRLAASPPLFVAHVCIHVDEQIPMQSSTCMQKTLRQWHLPHPHVQRCNAATNRQMRWLVVCILVCNKCFPCSGRLFYGVHTCAQQQILCADIGQPNVLRCNNNKRVPDSIHAARHRCGNMCIRDKLKLVYHVAAYL